MFTSFEDLEAAICSRGRTWRIALCGAHDSYALHAISTGRQRGVVEATLIGDENRIRNLLERNGEDPADYEIIDEPNESMAAGRAIREVYKGKADLPMKGLVRSTTYLTAIANPLRGLYPVDGLLSEATVFKHTDTNRLIIASDCALNVEPSLKDKRGITSNAISLARALGFSEVRVAVLSAAERPNPLIRQDADIEELTATNFGHDVYVQGPLALDNAVSAEAAAHKGITGEVAGRADVLLVPNLLAGNMLHKAIHFFGHMEYASVMCGTSTPVIFNSRTDDPRAKYLSILTAIAQDLYLREGVWIG